MAVLLEVVAGLSVAMNAKRFVCFILGSMFDQLS